MILLNTFPANDRISFELPSEVTARLFWGFWIVFCWTCMWVIWRLNHSATFYTNGWFLLLSLVNLIAFESCWFFVLMVDINLVLWFFFKLRIVLLVVVAIYGSLFRCSVPLMRFIRFLAFIVFAIAFFIFLSSGWNFDDKKSYEDAHTSGSNDICAFNLWMIYSDPRWRLW